MTAVTKKSEILKAVSTALPLMTEKQKGYFLGYAEAVSDMVKATEEPKPPRNIDRYGLKKEGE